MAGPGEIDIGLELDASEPKAQLENLVATLRKIVSEGKIVEKTLKKAFDSAGINAKQLAQTLRDLQRGNRSSALINAGFAGERANIRASDQGQQAQQIGLVRQRQQIEKQIGQQQIADQLTVAKGNQSAQNYLLNLRKKYFAQEQAETDKAVKKQESAASYVAGLRRKYEADAQKTAEALQKQRTGWQLVSAKWAEQQRQKELREAEALQKQKIAWQLESLKIEERRQAQAKRDADRAFRASPQGQDRAAEEQRESTRRRLLGDGGAALFAIQARLLLHFQVLSSLFAGLQGMGSFIVNLEKSLVQLQAITATTDANMRGLTATILDVSKTSKFSAVEVADAAVILGQAGFSTQQIQESIGAVVNLATATGSTLQEAVDIGSSVISVFNMRTDEMAQVANVATGALNLTKLTTEKLALGIQYAGNVAADAGINFTELVSVLGVFSNAGVKSGSTLGTGVRQLIIDLQNPSEQLRARLKQLGISLQQVDIRANGLVGVLQNLKSAGFTSADAMSTIEVRAAAAFTALSRGVDDIEKLQQALLLTDAASKASAIQMESLSAKASKFANAAGIVAKDLTDSVVTAMKKLLDMGTSLLNSFDGLGTAGRVLGNILTSVLAGAAIVATARLLGLVRVGAAVVAAFTASAGAAGVLSGILAALGGPFTLAAAGVAGVIGLMTDGFGLLSNEVEDTRGELDKVQTSLDKTKGEIDSKKQSVAALDTTIQGLIDRSANLTDGSDALATATVEAKVRFGELGLQTDQLKGSYDGLLGSLINLKAQMAAGLDVDLLRQADQIQAQIKAQTNVIDNTYNRDLQDKLTQQAPGFLTGRARIQAGLTGEKGTPSGQLASGNIPADIVAGINALNLRSVDAINEAIKQLRDNRNPEGDTYRENLIDTLRGLTGALQQNQASTIQKETVEADAGRASFVQRYGADFEQKLASIETGRNNAIADQLDGVTNNDQRQKIAAAIQTMVINQIKTVTEDLQSKLSPEDLGNFDSVYGDKLASLRTSTLDTLKTVMDDSKKAREQTWKEEVNLLNQEIDVRSRYLTSTAGKGKTKETFNQILERINKKEEFELKLQDAAGKEAGADPQQIARQREIIKAKAQAEREDLQRKLEETRIRAEKERDKKFKYNPATDGYQPRESRENKDELLVINQNFDKRLYQAGSTSRNLGYQEGAQGLPSQEGQITAAQQRQLALAREKVDTELLRSTAQIETERADAIKARQEDARKSVEILRTELGKLQDQAKAGVGVLSQEEGNKILARSNEVGHEMERLSTQIVQSQGEITEATQKAAEAQAEYNARVMEAQAMDIPGSIREGTEEWARQAGFFDSVNKRIADSTGTVLQSVNDGFVNMFTDVAMGTKSMKEAFAEFGQSVIETCIRVAAQQAVISLFSMMMGGGFTRQTQIGDASGGQGARAGFATGGVVTGGVPGRDSVAVRAMPGEFVLKKNAASSIGYDKLNEMNQRGAAALNDNPIVAMAAPADQDKGDINVWVVPGDQAPQMGPRDVVAVVSQDIRTGGPIKQLIQTVKR